MSKFGAAVFLVILLLALPACAVAQPQAQAFESISVRPSQSNSSRNMRVRVMPNGDMTASSVHVFVLVSYAYDLPLNSSLRFSTPARPVAGLYDIEAKAPSNAIPADLPAREKWIRMQRMLRALLADRFKLVMRVEQKTMPAYVLTVASGGPKFQKSSIADKDCVFEFNTGSCHGFDNDRRGHPLKSPAANMDDLALYIENWTDLPVVNRTSLNGLFAVDGEGWKPMVLPPRPPEFPQVPNFDDLPSIFDVLGKLGLELKQQEAAVPVYTIESIERPTENSR
jgi:uncharacterized protein (TIGR03435 family)